MISMEALDYLKKIEDAGYECFLVGGFVRDSLLGKTSYDLDITTSALPEEIIKIFNLETNPNYGCVSFCDGKYAIDITTYRVETKYEKRKPVELEYTKNILEDLKRRDFTINAICMRSDGSLFDPYDGLKDLGQKKLVSIGNAQDKFIEDPLRILRAIRFKVAYDLSFSPEVKSAIERQKGLVRTLSYERKRRELEALWKSSKVEGLEALDEIIGLDLLDIKMTHNLVDSDTLGLWAQLEYSKEYPFSKEEKEIIAKRRQKYLD